MSWINGLLALVGLELVNHVENYKKTLMDRTYMIIVMLLIYRVSREHSIVYYEAEEFLMVCGSSLA